MEKQLEQAWSHATVFCFYWEKVFAEIGVKDAATSSE